MTMANLMTLPTELHEIIISYLDFPSTAHLKHTCHYFDSVVKDIDIYEAEKSDYAQLHELWACRECQCLVPSSKLSDKMKKGNRSKTGSKAAKRFCVPCGVKIGLCGYSLYNPGDRIVISGTLHFICMACLQFTKNRAPKFTGLCEKCDDEGRGDEVQSSMSMRIAEARHEASALKREISRKATEIDLDRVERMVDLYWSHFHERNRRFSAEYYIECESLNL